MKTIILKGGCLNLTGKIILIIFLLFTLCKQSYAQYNYDIITIKNPFQRKIPIAIPLFKPGTENIAEVQISRESSDILSDALLFTSYFKIIDRAAFLEDPSKTGITAQNINFRNWVTVGSEYLVTGGVTLKDNTLDFELRFFDTVKGQLLIGKRYQGQKEDERRMIRKFCSEILYYLFKTYGYFDSKIAFISTGSGKKEVYISDFDGQNAKQFTKHNSITLSPSWSSDGSWIAYTAYVKGSPNILIKSIKDGHGAIISSQKGINISPSWAPGQFSMAASLSFSGDAEIYLLTGNGKIIKKMTSSWGIDVSPTWSPDGKKIAFVSDRSGNPQIYVMNVESGQVERLTFHGKYNTSPSWSPKGDKIAYCAMEGSEINICTIGPDGRGMMQFTGHQGMNETPTWSPDGSLIAFASNREGAHRIYVMTAYGTDQRRLFVLPGEQTNPSWSYRIAD